MEEVKTLKNKVFEALGEVSMCWSETPKGVFDSTNAERIGNELLHEFKIQKPIIDAENMQEYIKQIKETGIKVVKIEPTLKEVVEVLCNALREDSFKSISDYIANDIMNDSSWIDKKWIGKDKELSEFIANSFENYCTDEKWTNIG